jgi:formamidopyrimidine-DNA glycosylase
MGLGTAVGFMPVGYPRSVPELPEVESYRRLADGALRRPVASLSAPDPWFIKGGADQLALRRALVGHRLTAARRIGKLLLLDIDSGPTLGIRFGMTGTLVVDGEIGVEKLLHAPRRHEPVWDRFSMGFEDGGTVVVRDPRRLGGVLLDPDVSGLGPDAATIVPSALAAALRGSKAPLKARLLDQSRVAGIGNLIADEVLWRSGLSPLRPAGSLSPSEVKRLHRHLGRTIGDLTGRGGSHLGDLMEERHPGGRCPRDGGELARSIVGGRTSWWCPDHQG